MNPFLLQDLMGQLIYDLKEFLPDNTPSKKSTKGHS